MSNFQKEKIEFLSSLMEGIAHELGTPLNILQGRVELLEMKYIQQESEETFAKIFEQIRRITSLISVLLQYSKQARIDSGVVSSYDDYTQITCGFGRTVSIGEIPPDLRFLISPWHLSFVLEGLVQNALDSMKVSDPPIRLKIKNRLQFVEISIRDFGSGIDLKNLSKIWDPFFTTRLRGIGTGLGLTLIRMIVEAYGGQIRLVSTKNRGTMVVLRLVKNIK